MRKLLAPEALFGLGMWAVSVIFAGFLIGLGGKVIADIPRLESAPSVEQFSNPGRIRELRGQLVQANQSLPELTRAAQTARVQAERSRNAHSSSEQSLQAWLATRSVTGLQQQDPEVIRRTEEVVSLQKAAGADQQAFIQAQANQLERQQHAQRLQQEIDLLLEVGRPGYQQAIRAHELKVFLFRLALTLPLLVLSGWFIKTKRTSRYWPLMRGFVIASAFAFFFELVPYLPSYGGYVRYAVGIALTAAIGMWGIRWMQGYLQRRSEEERRGEAERRARMNNEEAIRKIATGLCPGCERPIMTTDDAKADFCVHCGLMLHNACGGCGKRKNAYFRHCMSCGTPSHVHAAGEGAAALP